jgi:hypothetical protein
MRLVSLAAWIAFLIATLAAVASLGGELAAPPVLAGRAAVSRWLDQRDAAVAIAALLRVAVLVLAWYLLAATVASAVMRLFRAGRATRIADALTLPPVRRIVYAALGAGIVGGAVVAATRVLTDPSPRPMRPPSDAASAVATEVPPVDAEPVNRQAAEEVLGLSPAEPGPREWTVAHGDHLWRIAERVLTDTWGRSPSDREIDPYWRQVIAANRSRLADPENADLLFPGQLLAVPEPPGDRQTSA